MSETYKALELSGPGKFSEVRKSLPGPGPNEVRTGIEACGVCHSAATMEALFPIGINDVRRAAKLTSEGWGMFLLC